MTLKVFFFAFFNVEECTRPSLTCLPRVTLTWQITLMLSVRLMSKEKPVQEEQEEEEQEQEEEEELIEP